MLHFEEGANAYITLAVDFEDHILCYRVVIENPSGSVRNIDVPAVSSLEDIAADIETMVGLGAGEVLEDLVPLHKAGYWLHVFNDGPLFSLN